MTRSSVKNLRMAIGMGLGTLAMLAVGSVQPSAAVQGTVTAPEAQRATQSASVDTTRAVQLVLRSFGYGIAVDGQYGPQTTKAVTHWQQSNGLTVDGIVGPETLGSLGLDAPATATAQAERINPPAAAVVESWVSGDCESFRHLAEAAGLPWHPFGTIYMPRESHCIPTVHNPRGLDDSYGLLQINTRGSLWGEIQRRCGVSAKSELWDPATNIRCAKALYDAYGLRPWRTS